MYFTQKALKQDVTVRYVSLVRSPYLSDTVVLSLQSRFNTICSCFVPGVKTIYIGLGYLLVMKNYILSHRREIVMHSILCPFGVLGIMNCLFSCSLWSHVLF